MVRELLVNVSSDILPLVHRYPGVDILYEGFSQLHKRSPNRH